MPPTPESQPDGLSKIRKYSLDDLYLMVSSIYSEQNAQRPPSATFTHFVEVCGMLTIHDRKKTREGLEVTDVLCKSLGWFFPLLAKFRVSSLEDLVFRKFPYACPYCRECPHKDSVCKTVLGTKRTVDHVAVQAKHAENSGRRPQSLNEWQRMFDRIYPRETKDLGSGHSTVGLLEELGELAEAVRVFDKHPKYFAGEAADVFSYIMGIANEHQLNLQMEGKPEFDFEAEFLRRYPGLCLQCGHEVCICPTVPDSTVGRLAKELDLAPIDRLFNLDPPSADKRGKQVGLSVLEELGGLPAIANQLPLDRGETNRAMVLLCLRLSDEIRSKDSKLSTALHEAAIRIATDTRNPGSKDQADASNVAVDLLSTVWPLLSLAVIPEDSSLPARLGKLLRAQSVRIGIVTALPKEFAAMRLMLDEQSWNPIAGDPNDYVVGSIPSVDGSGIHLVAVTLLKEIGNNSAAAAATHLLRSFPAVEDLLMVGIAGGIPVPDSPEAHVRLGDIAVSNKEGIVQYDNLRMGVDAIKLRSSAAKPSARMIGAANVLESESLSGKYPWEELITRGSSLDKGKRPADATDQLYLREGGATRLIDHPEDPSRRAGEPRVHYGRIGASNVLLKNPDLRDQLRMDCNVIAIEMESSGIADATWLSGSNYIVIRGICDYCDDKKNDMWQGYAAVAAAAFARALISQVSIRSYPNGKALT